MALEWATHVMKVVGSKVGPVYRTDIFHVDLLQKFF